MKFDKIIENQLDIIEGGLADNKSAEALADRHGVDLGIIYQQIEKGIEIEYEHTHDKNIAREIALDHIYEHPLYYNHLKDMEDDIEEAVTAGGSGNAFGDAGAIGQMGGKTSSDFYAPGDTRIPYSIFGGKVMTRNGSTGKKKNRKKKKKTKAKKHSSD